MTRDARSIQALLQRHELTQAHLARLFGVSQQAISLIRRGQRRMSPQFRQMIRLWWALPAKQQHKFLEETRTNGEHSKEVNAEHGRDSR